eukprot:TRINITY_DN3159_c1_g1_i5.p3 TRINITY_DN3159_c1_g1~~TRINITY_DN3159_c1_g1_i5.p3  ORF type:complete len:106 (+),score=2.37 TRINITY_DN3159_c1_g1_i5:170-487(+)
MWHLGSFLCPFRAELQQTKNKRCGNQLSKKSNKLEAMVKLCQKYRQLRVITFDNRNNKYESCKDRSTMKRRKEHPCQMRYNCLDGKAIDVPTQLTANDNLVDKFD